MADLRSFERKSIEKADVQYVEGLGSDFETQVQESFESMSLEQMKTLEKKRKHSMHPLRGFCFSNRFLVVRKVDFHLITSLFLLFIFNILDRSNIANARLGGLQTDLGLSDVQYQTSVAIMVCLSFSSIKTVCELIRTVRWLPWRPNPQQHPHDPCQALTIHSCCHFRLGRYLHVHSCLQKLCRYHDCSHPVGSG